MSTLLSIKDRRLPGRLRLLSAERPLRHRARSREADVTRYGAGRGPARPGRRRHPLLPGCRLAQPQGPRPRRGGRHGRGRQGARHGDLRHPRDAERVADGAARRCRPRLLQPQSRHLGIVLRRDHYHTHLSGPARHPGPCPRRRHQRLLRRHRRHGRIETRSRGHDRHAREPADPSGERAHQHVGADRGHTA
ncbi:hypothetical protein GBAR_LOCUS29180 [Geodia barretti]|uniref:Uncharacterized protein n=1 Tax=Geodia barretti TaxID=519541 RepID=A0AA35TUM9_GEOBA|nr:hypothetical protein GBAR_LOCUS29180 [Geodia barretti]